MLDSGSNGWDQRGMMDELLNITRLIGINCYVLEALAEVSDRKLILVRSYIVPYNKIWRPTNLNLIRDKQYGLFYCKVACKKLAFQEASSCKFVMLMSINRVCR